MSGIDLLELYHHSQPPYCILNEDHTVSPASFEAWMWWYAENRARTFIERTEVGTRIISTIFTGISSAWGSGPFETFIANQEQRGVVESYLTYHEAVDGHAKWVKEITRSALEKSN